MMSRRNFFFKIMEDDYQKLHPVPVFKCSTVPVGHSDRDWQEETYNKLKSLKDMYYTGNNALCQKFTEKYQQLNALHKEEKPAEMNQLKMCITGFECILQFLNSPKSAVIEGFGEKLAFYEKNFEGSSLSKTRKPVPLVQQPNSPAAASFSVMSQNLQQHDNPVKETTPVSKQVNDTGINMQCSPTSSMSMSRTTYNMSSPHAQDQGMLSSLQPAQNLDAALGNAFIPSPENVIILSQQNTLQSNTSMLYEQQPKQRHVLHMEHLLIENEPLLQQNQPWMEQQQLQEQQWHLMRQTRQMNADIHTGMFSVQHPQTSQMNVRYMQSFLVSPPQASQSLSPQKYQHTSPQMDQQKIHVSPLIAEFPSHYLLLTPCSSLSSIIIAINGSTPEMLSIS